jgi:hypothetical protein
MPVKAPYLKAPAPAYNWTGCYLGGGDLSCPFADHEHPKLRAEGAGSER